MKREIKFRGKVPHGEWVYGFYTYDSYGGVHLIDVIELKPELKQYNILVNGETVGQYTGLKDKNKKGIYEGDIVNCCRYENNEIYTVEVKDIRTLPREMFGSSLNWLEVIGNIYEKPEMVKTIEKH